jgi:hypothetical protein
MKRQLAEHSKHRSSVAQRTVKITFGITSAVVRWTWNYFYYNCKGRVFYEEVTWKAELQEHLMWKWRRVACDKLPEFIILLTFKTGQEIFKKTALHRIFERNSRKSCVKRKDVLSFIYVLCKVKFLSLNLLQQHYHRACDLSRRSVHAFKFWAWSSGVFCSV